MNMRHVLREIHQIVYNQILMRNLVQWRTPLETHSNADTN